MNEAQTRLELITPALKEAGWGEVEESRIRVEVQITDGRLIGNGRRTPPLIADYILEYKNRQLAVIEAKARKKYYTDGVAQAKDYAERLHIRHTFSTNGGRIYSIDMEEAREEEVSRFPTPEELWLKTYPPEETRQNPEVWNWKERFNSVPYELLMGKYLPRYYQRNAVDAVLNSIAERQDRLLLTMATGTGKTATAFHICWKLFQAKWNLSRDGQRRPRILFLADRNVLANQAIQSFGAFNDDATIRIRPDEIKKQGKVPTNASLFFTIFQTFMSGPDDSPYFGEYPEDFFDFIIIDECHRGGANDESSWRAIMEYFSPAVQLGLTATPKRNDNVDTYRYFGEPVYTYSLKAGINDGFLTPFKVKEISTTGDQYRYTPDDQVLEGEVDQEKEYSLEEQNRIIELMDVERYRVELFMDMMNQNQKTLVFCATQIHAAAVRDLINQIADSTNTNYCHRVTADDGARGEQHLNEFKDNERTIPTILTTSQKLSTGVDAPEVRNIVLMRPINSMVEFKQIVGRGTRVFDGKDYFTIYDFVNAHEHFNDPEWDGEPIEPEPPVPPPGPELCSVCGQSPCVCINEPVLCRVCGEYPCVCETSPRRMVRVKLSDNKVRELDSMVKTTFWSPDGTPISAEQFIENLFGELPDLIKSEDELRRIWSKPGTRKQLLQELSDRGYTGPQLEDLRNTIHGQDSDLFDVLSYVAYHSDIVPRTDRANRAKLHLDSYDPKQQEFINFVLAQYIKDGVGELDDDKLGNLLRLKYRAIADAKRELGDIPSIRETFVGFQEWLYRERVG
ncbi:restriction endonuclease subunit R [Rhodohalobacter sp. SW132]|uniref:EcoAI/FtnUII family type I restriction enzme subunit R n=1 Tax=Rhodohalobacter sp. SW132 TaxID=2293433 RepID=UPI000E2686B8|nr:type I restriction endonuclease subunit R [Rhodohalobacter sp. SW132]REL39137.1 restriction endonuclease subunit R [Rhodohalobacter sp. SW132]